MASEWYYIQDAKRLGPASSSELRTLAKTGQLETTDLVWKEGLADWVLAGKVKGLFGGQQTTAESSAQALTQSAVTANLETNPLPLLAARGKKHINWVANFPLYKKIHLELFYAQGLRIECDNCQQPFVYIDGGTDWGEGVGMILFARDDGMRERAFREALEHLVDHLQEKGNSGKAICPHCHYYQKFMLPTLRLRFTGCLAVILTYIILIVVNMLHIDYGVSWTLAGILVATVIGLLSWIVIKYFVTHRGPHPDLEDPHSMTDLQFEEFLHQCNQVDYDPFLEWWKNCDNHLGESQVPLSFGLKDTTGTSVYPREISTDYIIERYMTQF